MIYKFIIFFIILLLFRFFYIKNKEYKKNIKIKKENIDNIKYINIKYLDPIEACVILTNEYKEKYISNYTPIEMKSKYCISEDTYDNISNFSNDKLVEECKLNYCKNILTFSDNEKNIMNKLLQNLASQLKIYYPKFPYLVWKFIKIDDRIEDGLPHTRDDCIVLPVSYINDIVKLDKENKINLMMKEYGSLLIHEQTHVLQRINPKIFENLYTNIWPFKRAKYIRNMKKSKFQRSNPDALKPEWVYHLNNKEHILPISRLSPNSNFDLKYPDKIAIPLKRIKNNFFIKSNLDEVKLDSISEYYNEFCKIQQNYHPNEISAVFMSKIALYKMGYINLDKNELKCLESFKKWMDNTFAIQFDNDKQMK